MINQKDMIILVYLFGLTCLWWLILSYVFFFLINICYKQFFEKESTAVFVNYLEFQNIISEAATGKGLLKVSQISQETTCFGVSF